MKIYNTIQMISNLLNSNKNETYIKTNNKNYHVFKGIDGKLYYGIYGDGAIDKFEIELHEKELKNKWIKEELKVNNKNKRIVFKLNE